MRLTILRASLLLALAPLLTACPEKQGSSKGPATAGEEQSGEGAASEKQDEKKAAEPEEPESGGGGW